MDIELLPCAYRSLFGFDCPICGFQRALLLLAKGDIAASFILYPPLIPSLILIILFLSHLLNTKYVSRKLLVNYAAFVLVVISVNYFVKLII